MRLIPLIFFTSLLFGCFVGPVQDFVDQMDDQYFAEEFNNIPTEIKPYEKKASMQLIWENNIGDNEHPCTKPECHFFISPDLPLDET